MDIREAASIHGDHLLEGFRPADRPRLSGDDPGVVAGEDLVAGVEVTAVPDFVPDTADEGDVVLRQV
jgi:hypothetical protein